MHYTQTCTYNLFAPGQKRLTLVKVFIKNPKSFEAEFFVSHWINIHIYLFWRPSIECPTSRLEYNLNCPSLSSLAKLVISSVEILITRRLNNNHLKSGLLIVWNSNGCLNTRLNLVWYSNDFQIPDHFGDFCLVFQCQMLSSWTDRYFNWAGTKAAS